MKTLSVEKKENIFKRIYEGLKNKMAKSALYDILVDSSAGTYNEVETKTDEYSDAFKKAYANQEKNAETLSTLVGLDNYKEDNNPWKVKINEDSELTSSKLTKGKTRGRKPKSEDREISD